MPGRAVLLVLLAAAVLLPGSPLHGLTERAPDGGPAPVFAYAPAPADPAAATFAFGASVSELNRRAFLESVARVRPEAAALFDRVDGLVRIEDGDPGHGALGVTVPDADGYTIRFSFGAVYAELGRRGFDRLVQHELAHVVDFALVPDDVDRVLDDGIPPGLPCTSGTRTGSCAPRAERFAESFAKWASGDLGIDIYAGYAVPPPADLEAWGAPLAALARG